MRGKRMRRPSTVGSELPALSVVIVAANWQPDWPTTPGSTERNSPSSPAKSSCALASSVARDAGPAAPWETLIGASQTQRGMRVNVAGQQRKTDGRPRRNFPFVQVYVRLLGERQADARDLGARPGHLQRPGKSAAGLGYPARKRWRPTILRDVPPPGASPSLCAPSNRAHRASPAASSHTASGVAMRVMRSSRVPRRTTVCCGFAQIGAQGQTIEGGIGRMNHQSNVVRGPVRLRQNQAVAARAPGRRIHFHFHTLLVALGLALRQSQR